MHAELPPKFTMPQGLQNLPQMPQSLPSQASHSAPILSSPDIANTLEKFIQHVKLSVPTSSREVNPKPTQQLLKGFLSAHLTRLSPQQIQEKLEKADTPKVPFMIEDGHSHPVIVIPLIVGEQTKWITLQYYEETEESDVQENKRIFNFQLHFEFDHTGPILIDGRVNKPYFSLRLRTEDKIAVTLQAEIKKIFDENLKNFQLSGDLRFDQQEKIDPTYILQQVIYA